jgi:hypothetical protein
VIEYYKKNFNFVGSNHQLNKKTWEEEIKKQLKEKERWVLTEIRVKDHQKK